MKIVKDLKVAEYQITFCNKKSILSVNRTRCILISLFCVLYSDSKVSKWLLELGTAALEKLAGRYCNIGYVDWLFHGLNICDETAIEFNIQFSSGFDGIGDFEITGRGNILGFVRCDSGSGEELIT